MTQINIKEIEGRWEVRSCVTCTYNTYVNCASVGINCDSDLSGWQSSNLYTDACVLLTEVKRLTAENKKLKKSLVRYADIIESGR